MSNPNLHALFVENATLAEGAWETYRAARDHNAEVARQEATEAAWQALQTAKFWNTSPEEISRLRAAYNATLAPES